MLLRGQILAYHSIQIRLESHSVLADKMLQMFHMIPRGEETKRLIEWARSAHYHESTNSAHPVLVVEERPHTLDHSNKVPLQCQGPEGHGLNHCLKQDQDNPQHVEILRFVHEGLRTI